MAFLRKRRDVWHVYWTQNGKKRGRSLRTKSKRQADQFLKEFDHRLAAGALGQQSDITLERLFQEYLEHARTTLRDSTYERHVKPRVTRFVEFLKGRGLTKASQITQAHVEDYQKELLTELSPLSVRHCLYGASGMLSYAVRRAYLSNNVIRNVQKVKAPKNPPRFLSHEEWEKVEVIARETYLWPLVATAYYAGLRNTELRFLTWPEIDFEREVITIRNKPGFTLKNREFRTIPLNRELRESLLPLRKGSGACFTDPKGRQFVGAPKLYHEFDRLVVRPSGLPHFSLHTLRHTFASHLVMKGVSIYKVSQWLGHRSVTTTMIYAHLAPQDDEINVL